MLYAVVSCRMTGVTLWDFLLVHGPPAAFAAIVLGAGSAVKVLLEGWPHYQVLAVGLCTIGALSLVVLYVRASLFFGRYGVEVLQGRSFKESVVDQMNTD